MTINHLEREMTINLPTNFTINKLFISVQQKRVIYIYIDWVPLYGARNTEYLLCEGEYAKYFFSLFLPYLIECNLVYVFFFRLQMLFKNVIPYLEAESCEYNSQRRLFIHSRSYFADSYSIKFYSLFARFNFFLCWIICSADLRV